MSPLADPENPPPPPCPCRCACPDRGQNRDWDRDRDRDWDRGQNQNWDQNRDWDRGQSQNWDQNGHQDLNWDQNRDWDRTRNKNRDQNRDWDQTRNQNQNWDRTRNQNWDQTRDQNQHRARHQHCACDHSRDPNPPRSRSRCRRLVPALAALAAAALGAAAAAAAVLGTLRGQPAGKAATAAHVLLSAGLLSLPSSPGWRYEDGVQGTFLSSDIRRDTAGTLRVTSGGLYLLYGQLGLACVAAACPQGAVTLELRRATPPGLLLAVPLSLPRAAGGHRQRSALAQAVRRLQPGDILSLALVGDTAGDSVGDSAGDTGGWQLAQDEREGNFVGLLRIAGGDSTG